MDLQLHGVSKSFHQQNVLQQIDLLIPSGEICGLLGPSGSGKTTLIRLMIGAIQADAGSIQIGDTSMPSFKMLSQIGFMPQNDALYEDLSGLANLHFFGSLYNMSRQDLAKRIEEVLTLVDLTNDQKKLVRHYSGGMKKRLSLAISILHRPSILFLDEPTVGIDPVLRRQIWNQFQAIRAQGTTIVVSTHVMDEINECDRAALIYNGRIIAYDPLDRLLAQTENGQVEELFLLAGKDVT